MTDFPQYPFAWTLGRTETRFENAWIDVREISAQDPSGRPASYGLVHFKNLAVGILPYQDGDIWLVGQSRVAFESYSWEIPAGGAPFDEDPVEAARRELAEETGLRAASMTPLVELETSNSVTDERAIIYLATHLTPGPTAHESTEDITCLHVPLSDAVAAIEAGTLRDGISVAAILRLELMRLRGEIA
jgi:8-oxo-dGTP pyrophosphatase MutT (NUDIX family)